MVNETILAVIIAFVVSAVLCPIVIPFLHRLKFGQQVRDDGTFPPHCWGIFLRPRDFLKKIE